MARKESLDRALMARIRTQFQTTEVESLLNAASDDLLTYIRKVPLVYGFWGDFKRLAKAAEKSSAPESIAALLARLDTANLPRHSPYPASAPLQDQIDGVGRMQFDGAYAYVLSSDWRSHGVHVIDMTLPAMPVISAHIKLQGLVDIAVNGTQMALLQGSSWIGSGRLSRYDISDPLHPKPEGGIEIGHGVRMAVSGSLIAVLTVQGRRPGLYLVDASLPGQLRLLGYLALSAAVAIQIEGNIAYIVNSASRGQSINRLLIVDLSNPLEPRQIHEIPIPPTQDMVVQGRYAYLTCSHGRSTPPDAQSGLAVIDLAPPDFVGARQIALLPLGNVHSLAVQGHYAYISVGRTSYQDKNTGGLRIVDIADPTHPQLVGSFVAENAGALTVVEETVCMGITHQWHNHFRALHVADPVHPRSLGASPSRETLGYMKRRGRRLLRTLALRDPETYVRTAVQILMEAGQAQPELDPRTQWISMDLLYGGGTRYEQQAHGRGSYGTPRHGFSLRTREERFPELWDRYPELAEQLYTTPKLPWETWEAACKILRSARSPLPALSDKMLAGFLASESPLLRSVAGRQVVETLAADRTVAADFVADTYFGGTRRQRETIDRFLLQQESNARWTAAFASRLYQRASFVVEGAYLPRKATLAFALLISRFPTLFHRDILPKTVAALYNTHRPDFTAWTLDVLQNILPMQLPDWLTALEALPAETRETALLAVVTGFETKEIPPLKAGDLVRHPSAWIRQTIWRILAHSRTPLADIATVWGILLDSHEPTPGLLTAFDSPDALALFARCDFDSRRMADLVEAHPFLIPLLPTAALEKVVAVLPPASVIRLVSEATEVQWPGLRLAILLGPLLPERRAAFWREVFAAIGATGATGDGHLVRRLLADAQMQAAFLQLADVAEFLRSANPVFGPLLGLWIGAHTDLLRRDSADLLQIATHPLPEIRIVGLRRVREVGMSLPFALRLLESELPPSVALGKTFFEAMEADDNLRTEAITALCDSPKPSVRAYGREVLTARPEMLADTDVLERLSENPDPETQAFVAGKLLALPTTADRTGAFDRAVLRSRDRGRRAKEFVKARLDTQPTLDVALLLEMARSRTPRDADWAMGQLAKLALDGVEIPGFTLDGVAGG